MISEGIARGCLKRREQSGYRHLGSPAISESDPSSCRGVARSELANGAPDRSGVDLQTSPKGAISFKWIYQHNIDTERQRWQA